jgi:hypothetical protein
MKRTPTLIILVLVLTVGAALLAVRKYNSQPVTAQAKTVDYKALYTAEAKQVKSLTNTNGVLQATATQMTTQKTALCSELSAHKVTEALCK